MKWCLTARQTEEYLEKADEIKVFWQNHRKPDILSLTDINPKARILILPSFELTLFDDDYKWLSQQLILCKNNMAVIVIDDQQAQHCKDLNIPFFFVYPARTFQQLNRMRAWGATDAYIDDMLCHSLDTIEEYYDELQIRVVANSCGWGTAEGIWDGIEGSWFRPEDLWKLDQIDVAEFQTNLEASTDTRRQEQALYRIYAEKHEWAGKLDDFIFDIKKKGILNRLLSEDFQFRRNNCKMKCMENQHCQHCKIYCNMALESIAEKMKNNINEMENKNG